MGGGGFARGVAGDRTGWGEEAEPPVPPPAPPPAAAVPLPAVVVPPVVVVAPVPPSGLPPTVPPLVTCAGTAYWCRTFCLCWSPVGEERRNVRKHC